MNKVKKFVIRVSYETVVGASNEDTAIMQMQILFSQYRTLLGNVDNLEIDILPPDSEVCSYGRLNRTCDRTKCKECQYEDILQAMNEDADDEKSGRYD